MKNLILTTVVALFFCFTAFGQSAGKCQPKCGTTNAQSASLYSLTDFTKCGVAEAPSCGVATTKKSGVAQSPGCGGAGASTVNYSLTKSCTPAPKCGGVAETTGCKPAVAQKAVNVKPKGKAIAKL